jgi:amidohydrolase
MKLIPEIVAQQADMAQLRQDIHAHPELAFEEQRTAHLIAEHLTAWGISVHQGLAKTGVVGTIVGTAGTSQRALGLRADMDALPLQEANTFSYRSTHPGKMHACGHDGHVAMLMGAARYLAQHKAHFAGRVHLIFQPAEEQEGGAQQMIHDGLFEKFPCDAVFALHNWPGMPVGTFGIRQGAIMASSSEFKIIVKGQGAHAALPHTGADPIFAACQIANSLQSVITRNKNPLHAAVLSITQIHAGSATNIIPDQAWLEGTVRTFDLATLDLIEQRVHAIAAHTAEAFGCTLEFEFVRNYPPTINHPNETNLALDVMRSLVTPDCIYADVEPTMGAEDFAFMLQAKPGCYMFIGNGEGQQALPGHGPGPCILHSPSYDFNDEIIPLGSSFWVKLVETYLKP